MISQPKPMRSTKPLLIGVGVGPGEPDLITVKALDALSAADVILVPSTETSTGGLGRAEQIVCANRPQLAERIRRIPFSMADKQGVSKRRKDSWEISAEAAIAAFEAGASTVCFATLGDPSVFSTFSYLAGTVREHLPEVEVQVIPGITAMQALAAASVIPLAEGTEVLALVPATAGDETLRKVLDLADTVVAYKAGRTLPAVLASIDKAGDRTTVIGTNLGLPNQRLSTIDEIADNETAPYFSAVLSVRHRETTGGRL